MTDTHNPLKILEGAQLSAITFVQDYVQFHFDGPVLTAITTPNLHINNQILTWKMSEYRNCLCGQIGKIVKRASSVDGEELRIEFTEGSDISISLKESDYRGAEAAIFNNPPKPVCVWRL